MSNRTLEGNIDSDFSKEPTNEDRRRLWSRHFSSLHVQAYNLLTSTGFCKGWRREEKERRKRREREREKKSEDMRKELAHKGDADRKGERWGICSPAATIAGLRFTKGELRNVTVSCFPRNDARVPRSRASRLRRQHALRRRHAHTASGALLCIQRLKMPKFNSITAANRDRPIRGARKRLVWNEHVE